VVGFAESHPWFVFFAGDLAGAFLGVLGRFPFSLSLCSSSFSIPQYVQSAPELNLGVYFMGMYTGGRNVLFLLMLLGRFG